MSEPDNDESTLSAKLGGDYSQESIGMYINGLEEKLSQERVSAQIQAAKRASKQQQINFMVNHAIQRSTLEILAVFGLAKIDR